ARKEHSGISTGCGGRKAWSCSMGYILWQLCISVQPDRFAAHLCVDCGNCCGNLASHKPVTVRCRRSECGRSSVTEPLRKTIQIGRENGCDHRRFAWFGPGDGARVPEAWSASRSAGA